MPIRPIPIDVVALNHEAMATVFEFRVRHPEPEYARQAIRAAFQEVDRIERLLSRFREGSDIWRINHGEPGQVLTVSEECHACLSLAADLHLRTGGAFDATLGGAVDAIRAERGREPAPGVLVRALRDRAAVAIDPEACRVAVATAGAQLDLGAIGKGYALDRARGLLAEWEIPDALLSAGGSSVWAQGAGRDGEQGWRTNLKGARATFAMRLTEQALGASGSDEQGRHIVNPRTGSQNYLHTRAWALAPTAAAADALSTAWMTMHKAEIGETLAALGPGHEAFVEDGDGALWQITKDGQPVPAANEPPTA